VLFNATPGQVAGDNAEIQAAITHAVVRHRLSRARLTQAVSDAEAAKVEVAACGA
jgi:hypothetical protein